MSFSEWISSHLQGVQDHLGITALGIADHGLEHKPPLKVMTKKQLAVVITNQFKTADPWFAKLTL